MKLEYFNKTDIEYQSYLSLPKALVINVEFKKVSAEAKILYALMVDRMKLSLQNDFFDKNGNIYIIYTLNEIMNSLNISEPTAIKRIKELEKLGFIEKKQQGLNKPNLIYVKKILFGEIVNQYLIKKNDNMKKRDVIKIENLMKL